MNNKNRKVINPDKMRCKFCNRTLAMGKNWNTTAKKNRQYRCVPACEGVKKARYLPSAQAEIEDYKILVSGLEQERKHLEVTLEEANERLEKAEATIDAIRGIVGFPGTEVLKRHKLSEDLPDIVRYCHREWLDQTHALEQKLLGEQVKADRRRDLLREIVKKGGRHWYGEDLHNKILKEVDEVKTKIKLYVLHDIVQDRLLAEMQTPVGDPMTLGAVDPAMDGNYFKRLVTCGFLEKPGESHGLKKWWVWAKNSKYVVMSDEFGFNVKDIRIRCMTFSEEEDG